MTVTIGAMAAMLKTDEIVVLENKGDNNMSMVYFNRGKIQDIAALLDKFLRDNPKQFQIFLMFSNRELLESEIPLNAFEIMALLTTLMRTGKLPDKPMLIEDGIKHEERANKSV